MTSYQSSEASEIKLRRAWSPTGIPFSPSVKLAQAQGAAIKRSKTTIIPPNGLSIQLDEGQINEMDNKERKKYQLWKEKYKTA